MDTLELVKAPILKTGPKVKVLEEAHGAGWSLCQADCVQFAEQMPDECVHLSIYSPPFSSLFTYSDFAADMGNCVDDAEFMEQYRFLVEQNIRITKPGRLSCVHCIDLPSFKWKHGEIGLRDFPGEIIRAHVDAGWIFHSRITIWKCPVVEMTRTKTVGLLHKTIKKDSSMSRVGLPDYVLVFRKPGLNDDFISHTAAEFPVDQWQKWASPIWMDIDQTDVLNAKFAKDSQFEKHLCPLQLQTIERLCVLWSNPGEIVWSPFAGVGSEGYKALQYKRRFIGTELKNSYFRTACEYLARMESESETLFYLVG